MADRTGKIGPPLKQNATKAIIYKVHLSKNLKIYFRIRTHNTPAASQGVNLLGGVRQKCTII